MDYLVDHSLCHNMNYGCSKIYIDTNYVDKNYVVKQVVQRFMLTRMMFDKNYDVVEGPRRKFYGDFM